MGAVTLAGARALRSARQFRYADPMAKSKKVWVKDITSGQRIEADARLRCVPVPDDFEVERKGVTVVQDDGPIVRLSLEGRANWTVDAMELGQARQGEMVCCRIGPSAQLGGAFWPVVEILG